MRKLNRNVRKTNKGKNMEKAEHKRVKNAPLSLGAKFRLNTIKLDIEATQSVYLRTGQTIASYSSGSQVYALNLPNLIASSNNFTKFITSGVPNFEYIKVTGFTLTWYPSNIVAVQGTFEPAAFDFRYIATYSTDSVLPTGYQGNYNESHYNVLLQQSARPRTMVFPLLELPSYITTEGNRQCMGQVINGYNFYNYASSIGGILSIIQTTPSVNTISAYNPKLGFIEIKLHCELYNSIV
jgi:hypothetical protein